MSKIVTAKQSVLKFVEFAEFAERGMLTNCFAFWVEYRFVVTFCDQNIAADRYHLI